MYQEQAECAKAGYAISAGSLGGGRLIDKPSPTLSENIDYRIENLKAQVARLENVKRLLSEPAGLLAVPIDDLRFAMNY